MSERKSLELRVSVDVGSRRHSVAIGLSDGQVLEEFEITDRTEVFSRVFLAYRKASKGTRVGVAVAMERYNGYAAARQQVTARFPSQELTETHHPIPAAHVRTR